MRKHQHGMSLIGFIIVGILVALVAITAMRIAPSVMEYYNIVKIINALVKSGDAQGTPQEIRAAFERRADIDDIQSIKKNDLIVNKSGGQTILSFAYEKRINLFNNVDLCISYEASTAPGAVSMKRSVE